MTAPRDSETERRTWAVDTMLAAHPDLSRDDAEALYARVAARATVTPIAPRDAPPPALAGPIRLRSKPAGSRPPPATIRSALMLALATIGIVAAVLGLAARIVGLP